MRHEDDRAALAKPDALQLEVQLVARERIERAERFVHQKKVWCARQCAGDCRPLTHAAGELARPGALESGDSDEAAEFARLAEPLGFRQPAKAQRQRNVALDREPGKQVRVLKHDAELLERVGIAAVVPPQLALADSDRSRAGPDKARDHAQDRRLPAS